jgi:hypothetical protein
VIGIQTDPRSGRLSASMVLEVEVEMLVVETNAKIRHWHWGPAPDQFGRLLSHSIPPTSVPPQTWFRPDRLASKR